ncbi:hydrolase, alpha/beta fold family, putative [Synechococcus sp. PCC 7335]|uniref:alpha/beta fold hydrolase n=1 Tax=Synechococcus sp. (strain ATCC 29403 / PCC 7335) TaxID=91464 RepID=UPI00017EBC05|nr:alpha/beta fold hydrolase [Synechococcus sp. PCC 7335]EDX84216.1 hydrolase, alpha/beta fold family, putative [Synechococcus sp. PCC 7335]
MVSPTDSTPSFVLEDFELQCGLNLPNARLVYQTYGVLNSAHSNAVLYPTSYGAQHTDVDWLVRPGGILDPTKWFVIMPNMFGNGLSTSPSNCEAAKSIDFYFTHYDNVRAQRSLLDSLDIERLALVYGWSMGAQQAYYWGALYPERVARIVAVCGTARTTDHNRIFLYSLQAALRGDPVWNGERFEGVPERGFRTFTQIYASWAASQAYYRAAPYLEWGYDSLEDYLLRSWEAGYRKRDPHNLLAMIETWLRCDVSDNPAYEGDYEQAMRAITAKTLVMPATTDLYFTPEDCEAEASLISDSEYRPIPSIWGHRAGNPYQNSEDELFIKRAVDELLASH